MSRYNRYNNQYQQPQAEKPPTAYDKLKPYLTRTNIAVSAFMLIAIISFGLLYIQGVSTNCQNPISYYLYCNTIPNVRLATFFNSSIFILFQEDMVFCFYRKA